MERKRKSHKRRWRSPVKEKILFLLAAGLAMGMTRSPRHYFRILTGIPRELRRINRRYLYRLLNEFRNEKLIEYQELADGTVRVVLTEAGRQRAHQFHIDKLEIAKPARWDGNWHLVFFDIPEKIRRARDGLREKLQELGLYEWQKSVFVYPYPCRREIEFLAEFFEIRPYVRYGELNHPLNEAELKLRFNLV